MSNLSTPPFPLGVALSDYRAGDAAWWLGGDNAFGTNLGGGRSFWAFGDTYISPTGQPRSNTRVAGNTIALVSPGSPPAYYYRGTPDAPAAFFADPLVGYRFWPLKGLLYAGKLFVFLTLRCGPQAIPAASFVARVNNPQDSPLGWRIDYLGLVGGNALQLGDEARLDGNGLVIHGAFNSAAHDIARGVVVRFDPDALLETPTFTWISPAAASYLAQDSGGGSVWRPGLGGTDAAGVPDYYDTRSGTQLGWSLRYNATLGAWQVVSITDTPATVRVWTNPDPFGPWLDGPNTRAATIHQFAEMDPSSPSWIEGAVCYGVREWFPAGSDDRQITFTYTLSGTTPSYTEADDRLYQIRSLRVPHPFL